MAMQLRRMKRDTITMHGFRSTFRDWASEQTSFPHETCEGLTAIHEDLFAYFKLCEEPSCYLYSVLVFMVGLLTLFCLCITRY
jgi:hypothetical protein